MEAIDKVDYFPYTHGDMIEKQRKALLELQRHEQLVEIRDRQTKEN
jgi:hypothetical protein